MSVSYKRHYFCFLRGLRRRGAPLKLSRLESDSCEEGEHGTRLRFFFLDFFDTDFLKTGVVSDTPGDWVPISLGTHASFSKSHICFLCTCLQWDGTGRFFLGGVFTSLVRPFLSLSGFTSSQDSGSFRYFVGINTSPRRTGKCRTQNVFMIRSRWR